MCESKNNIKMPYRNVASKTCIVLSSYERDRHSTVKDVMLLAQKYSPVLFRGYSVVNRSVVHKRSWLEVCDHKHR